MIKKLLRKSGDKRELESILLKLSPRDFSTLLDEARPEVRKKILSQLSESMLLKLLPEVSESVRVEYIASLDTRKASKLLERLPPDECVDILAKLPARKRKSILESFGEKKKEEILKLLEYSPETAGGLMTTEFIALNQDTTAEKAISYVRKKAKNYPVYYIYVVDDEGKLTGVLSLRQLILASPREKLKKIMKKEIVKVTPETDQEVVANLMKDYNLVALPVVDRKGRILGIVTADDAMEVLEKEATEDIVGMSGVKLMNGLLSTPPRLMVKARLPWLLIGILGELIGASVVTSFEKTLSTYLLLAAFMPVILYVSSATGTQSQSILIRALALNPRLEAKRYILREAKIVSVLATICGGFISLIATLSIGMPLLGLIVGLAMFLSILLISTIATFLPLIFRRVGIDPTTASTPMCSVISDVLTLVIYFWIATLLLNVFKTTSLVN